MCTRPGSAEGSSRVSQAGPAITPCSTGHHAGLQVAAYTVAICAAAQVAMLDFGYKCTHSGHLGCRAEGSEKGVQAFKPAGQAGATPCAWRNQPALTQAACCEGSQQTLAADKYAALLIVRICADAWLAPQPSCRILLHLYATHVPDYPGSAQQWATWAQTSSSSCSNALSGAIQSAIYRRARAWPPQGRGRFTAGT